MRHLFIAGSLLASLFVAGCHENIIKLRLPDLEMAQVVEDSPLTIAVATFQDQRPTPEHLGVYIDLGGEKEYFNLRDGSLSDVATRSFVHFLNQAGFSASDATDAETADIRIEAEIEQFRADATGNILSTLLEVNTTIVFTIHNATDGSTARVRIAAGETSEEANFGHFSTQDMETLINSVLKEGFMNLLNTVEIRGQTFKVTSHFPLDSPTVSQGNPTLDVLRAPLIDPA